MKWFRSVDLEVDHKPDGSHVTRADVDAERAIRAVIQAERPGDGIIGEELEPVVSTTGVTWTIDPIDGTMSYVHGVPLFSTLVAASDENGPAVGVIEAPAVGEIAVAGRGLGCTVNDRPARVGSASVLSEATLVTSGLSDYWPAGALGRLLGCGGAVRTWADGGYGYILLASGRIDVMIDAWVKPWDVAAAACIVPEAGGVVREVRTGVDTGYVATNAALIKSAAALLAHR